MLRLSKYTHLFRRDGTGFVYNSRTNSFFELPESAFETLRRIDENGADACADDDFLTDLHRRKILTTQEEDDRYLNFLKLSYFSSAYSRDVLGLTILPTIACNLRCPYCFEATKPTGIMSDDVIDKLMEFIKINARNKKYAITWFGGEPLLGLDVIEKILERLEEEKDYIRVNHTIITNISFQANRIDIANKGLKNQLQIHPNCPSPYK